MLQQLLYMKQNTLSLIWTQENCTPSSYRSFVIAINVQCEWLDKKAVREKQLVHGFLLHIFLVTNTGGLSFFWYNTTFIGKILTYDGPVEFLWTNREVRESCTVGWLIVTC